MADKIIRNSKLDTVLDMLATKLPAIFWRKAETTQVSIDNTPTANSNNLVKSGGVYSFVGNPIVGVSVPDPYDGTVVFTQRNGDTITLDLNHLHSNYYSKSVATSQPAGGFLPDVAYSLGELSGSQTFTFASAVSGNVNHYYFKFDSGSTAVVPTWPVSITNWSGNCVDSGTGLPVIAANKSYEVSVIGANAVIQEW